MKKMVLAFGILIACFSIVLGTDALTLSNLSGQSLTNINDPKTLKMLQGVKPGQVNPLDYRRDNRRGDKPDAAKNPEETAPEMVETPEKKPVPFYVETYPEDLPIFGQDLFVNKPKNVSTKESAATVPGDYVLGPGDTFRLLFSGKEFKEVEVVVDGEGMVFVPDMGMIPAAGLRFSEFKTMLASTTKQKMIGYELTHVTLSSLRSMRIFLLGNVKNPGTHHVSSLTSLMQLLIETGGILPSGSLRTVQIKRNGVADKTIDLYGLLLSGKDNGEIRLQDGDTVFVPMIGNTIALTGTVKKPAIYEIDKEKTIADIAQLAGGLLPNAQLIKIERIDDNKNRTIIDVNLAKKESLHAAVKSGDIIHVLPSSDSRRETVTLTGYIDRGGVFQWFKGMRLSDIISGPDILLPQTDLSHLLVIRTNVKNRQLEPLSANLERALSDRASPDNMLLQPNDQIQLFSVSADHSKNLQSVVEKLRNQGRYNNTDKLVSIEGNVRFPGEYPYVSNMSLKQLVMASGDVRSNTDLDYCLIIRSDSLGRIQPFSVRLREVFGMDGIGKNVSLRPMDQVLVFTLDEKVKRKTVDKDDKGAPVDEWEEKNAIFAGTSKENVRKTPGKNMQAPDVDQWSIDALKKAKDKKGTDQEQNEEREESDGQKSTKQPGGAKGVDIALENEEMENVLVGFLLKNSTSDPVENRSNEAYRSQLVDPALHENQSRLLQLLLKKRDLRQMVREELQPVKEKPVKSRQVLIKPILDKLQEQATKDSPAQIIQIGGAVRYPGKYPLEPGMRVSNLLMAGGGLAEPAYHLEAEINHFEVDDTQFTRMHHATVNLHKIMQGDPTMDQALQPYDIVIVKQNPKWGDINSVMLEGNVRFPGVYPIQPGEKLTQVLKRAGGLTELAYPEAAVFTRTKLIEKEKRENDSLIARMETQLVQTQYMKQTEKEADTLNPNSAMIHELIAKLKTAKPLGRLAIDLNQVMANPGGQYDVMLQDGDHLIVPQRTDEVTVMGEVYFPTSHQFIGDKDLESYVQASGGYTSNADDSRVYVVRADGRVTSKKQPGKFPVMGWFASNNAITIGPGDTVVVPMNVEKVAPMVLWKDITQILYNMAVTSAALKSAGAL